MNEDVKRKGPTLKEWKDAVVKKIGENRKHEDARIAEFVREIEKGGRFLSKGTKDVLAGTQDLILKTPLANRLYARYTNKVREGVASFYEMRRKNIGEDRDSLKARFDANTNSIQQYEKSADDLKAIGEEAKGSLKESLAQQLRFENKDLEQRIAGLDDKEATIASIGKKFEEKRTAVSEKMLAYYTKQLEVLQKENRELRVIEEQIAKRHEKLNKEASIYRRENAALESELTRLEKRNMQMENRTQRNEKKIEKQNKKKTEEMRLSMETNQANIERIMLQVQAENVQITSLLLNMADKIKLLEAKKAEFYSIKHIEYAPISENNDVVNQNESKVDPVQEKKGDGSFGATSSFDVSSKSSVQTPENPFNANASKSEVTATSGGVEGAEHDEDNEDDPWVSIANR
jgi:DNA repair exonuclease SbcCD ATPase subunit